MKPLSFFAAAAAALWAACAGGAEHPTPDAAFAAAARSGRLVCVVMTALETLDLRVQPMPSPWDAPDVRKRLAAHFECVRLPAEKHVLLGQHWYLAPNVAVVLTPRGGFVTRNLQGVLDGGEAFDKCLAAWRAHARADDDAFAARVASFCEGRAPPAEAPAEGAGREDPDGAAEDDFAEAILDRFEPPDQAADGEALLRECLDRFQRAAAREVAERMRADGTLAEERLAFLWARADCNQERFAESEQTLTRLARRQDDVGRDAVLWLVKLTFYRDGDAKALAYIDGLLGAKGRKKIPAAWADDLRRLRKEIAAITPSARPTRILLDGGMGR